MPQKLFFLLILLFSTSFLIGQATPDVKKAEETEKLRKDAVAFLRETMADVNSMRSLENRLSFSAEMASLMWFHDDKEARAMYLGVTSDLRQLLVECDTQLNRIVLTEPAGDGDEYISAGLFGEMSEKTNIARKLQKALEMRKQIALSLAEHEPDMAMAFYYDSLTAVTNPEFRKSTEEQDKYFELQLMNQVAESNAAKAALLGKKSLDKGVTYQHIELLKKVYAKDGEKGIDFAGAMVSKIKSSKDESDLWVISSFVRFGEETAEKTAKPNDKKPVITTQEIRDLVEIMAQNVLSGDDEADAGTNYSDLFEKYAPSRANQIKAKFKNRKPEYSIATNSAHTAVNAVAVAANGAAVAMPNPEADRKAKAIEDKIEAERKLMEDVAGLGTKSLPRDERAKIVAQARKIISQTPGKDKKITGLSLLAAQVAKAGDRELAAEIMKDAAGLVNPQPKNYQDFLITWMLIAGYAEVDTEKAFPMLTETILRLNETIAAFFKAAEFIDVKGEMIGDGEVQVGQFGGSMLRGLTKELQIAKPTLRSLARADLAKTKAATNSFDRPEVRVLVKMLVLRTVLDEKKVDDRSDQANIALDGKDINQPR